MTDPHAATRVRRLLPAIGLAMAGVLFFLKSEKEFADHL